LVLLRKTNENTAQRAVNSAVQAAKHLSGSPGAFYTTPFQAIPGLSNQNHLFTA
jgi:hypothetical protein